MGAHSACDTPKELNMKLILLFVVFAAAMVAEAKPYGYHYGKRSADAEPGYYHGKREAEPYGYGGYHYGKREAEPGYGYYYGKRSADAEPRYGYYGKREAEPGY